MNLWKPVALVSTSALVLVVGYQAASASPEPQKPPQQIGEAQPHMKAALAALNVAKTELGKAEHDKGGWRAAAQASTQTAINETQRGIAFDDHH
jgi:hypothetical protein